MCRGGEVKFRTKLGLHSPLLAHVQGPPLHASFVHLYPNFCLCQGYHILNPGRCLAMRLVTKKCLKHQVNKSGYYGNYSLHGSVSMITMVTAHWVSKSGYHGN